MHQVAGQTVTQTRRAELLDELEVLPPVAQVPAFFQEIAAQAIAVRVSDNRIGAFDPGREREIPGGLIAVASRWLHALCRRAATVQTAQRAIHAVFSQVV